MVKPLLPEITDHAFYRYCERFIGVDKEDMARAILTDEIIDVIARVKTGIYKNDEICIRFQNSKIITVYKRGVKDQYN